MKCHAGIEFESGKPCPKCGARLGEVCWPGINADLLEVVQLRKEDERLRQRVAVLEMVIREELFSDECTDDANAMIVEQIHDKMSPVSPADHKSET